MSSLKEQLRHSKERGWARQLLSSDLKLYLFTRQIAIKHF